MTIHQQRPSRSFIQPRSWFVLTPGRRLLVVLAVAAAWLLVSPAARAVAATSGAFVPPLPLPVVVLHGFDLPSEPWLVGNRGVDLAAKTGESVFAAAAGTVVYAGVLAGRGVISISHGAIRTTYEPVDPAVRAGEVVTQGEMIGRLSDAVDACGPPGSCLHWGAITASGYIDPLAFLRPPKIRLLPIWTAGFPFAGSDAMPSPAANVAADAVHTNAAPTTSATPSGTTRSGSITAATAAISAAATVTAGLGAGGVALRLRHRARR